MDLQTVLPANHSPDLQEMLFPGTRGIGPDRSGMDERFGEYLQRALAGDDSPPKEEAGEAEHTSASEKNLANRAKETGEERREAKSADSGNTTPGRADGMKEASGDQKAAKNEKISKEDTSGEKNKKSAEAAGSEAEGSEKKATKTALKDEKNGREKGLKRDMEAGKEEGESPLRHAGREKAGSPEETEDKSRDAASAMTRGVSEAGRTVSDSPAGGRSQESAAAGKSDFSGSGNKNSGEQQEPTFTVIDLRKGRGKDGAGKNTERIKDGSKKGREVPSAGKESFKGTVDRVAAGEDRGGDSAVRLVRPEGDAPPVREHSERAGFKPGLSQDQQALFKSMRESGNGEIVKRAGIIVKDNSSGEIRMDLKPEKLGKVRIQIHLKDNTLSGKIIVDSSAVREVFESNMEALHRAFKESGFDSAELDVQVGGGKQQEHQGSQKQRPRTAENIRSLEEHVSLARDGGYYEGIIDLVV